MARRDDLMTQISTVLSIPVVEKGVGSSVHNDFIDPLADAVLGTELAETFHDKYRKIEAVIRALGGTYIPADPDQRGVGHTSEGSRSGGGGTLTNLGLETILDLLLANGVPYFGDTMSADVQSRVNEGFDPLEIVDERVRTYREVPQRSGATKFRRDVRAAYGDQCCVTRTDAPAALEAAHIAPYLGTASDLVSNALLLRADIHKLHDALLLAVNDETLEVMLKPGLLTSSYGKLQGRRIAEPRGVMLSREALKFHRLRCNL